MKTLWGGKGAEARVRYHGGRPAIEGASELGKGVIECGRGEWNYRGNGGMCRYREENAWRGRVSVPLLTLRGANVGGEPE